LNDENFTPPCLIRQAKNYQPNKPGRCMNPVQLSIFPYFLQKSVFFVLCD